MKQRIISGVIGAALVIIVLFARETFILNLVIGAALVIAMFESQHATGLVKNNKFLILNCIFAFASAFFPLFGFMPTGLLITAIYRARKRHHHQEQGRAHELQSQGRRNLRAQPDRHPRPRGLHLRSLPCAGRVRRRAFGR